MLRKILYEAVSRNASDIHLTVGQPPFLRVAGEIFQSGEILTAQDVAKFLDELLMPRLRGELEKNLAVDFSHVEESMFIISEKIPRLHCALSPKKFRHSTNSAHQLRLKIFSQPRRA